MAYLNRLAMHTRTLVGAVVALVLLTVPVHRATGQLATEARMMRDRPTIPDNTRLVIDWKGTPVDVILQSLNGGYATLLITTDPPDPSHVTHKRAAGVGLLAVRRTR